MKRRTVLQVTAAMLALPGAVFAQEPRRFRVGCLYLAAEPLIRPFQNAFVAGLRERGYMEGRNLIVDLRTAEGDSSRLPSLIDELLSLRPDVLFGIEPMAVLMKKKTSTIPIVIAVSPDPVAAGLVQSLARPGGNVTGVASSGVERIGKNVELLAEINPRMRRIALLNDPLDVAAPLFEKYARDAASAKRLSFITVGARDAEEVRQAFATIEEERAEAVVVVATGRTNHLRHEIIDELRRLRLPGASGHAADIWAENGGMISNSVDLSAVFRYSASYVDRVFKGAKPAELPVERWDRFVLTINMRAAREMGVKIPEPVLARADRVIE